MRQLSSFAAVLLLSSVAHADRVHLKDGAVLEGRASRVGDRVVIEIESGAVTVDASEVKAIESAESHLDHVVKRRAALAPGDVHGRLVLVRFCKEHGLTAHEAELLREVLDLAPDNAEARAALGYVKHEGQWMTQGDAMLAQGYVQHDGKWVTPEQRMRLESYEAAAEVAKLQREQAKLELQAAREQAEQREREAAAAERASNAAPRSITYFTPFAYWQHDHHHHGRSNAHVQQPPPARERPRPAPPPRKPVAAKTGSRNPRIP